MVTRTCGFGSANLGKLGPDPANEAESNASTIVRLVLVSPGGLRPALASVGPEQQRTPLSGGLPGWRIASPRTTDCRLTIRCRSQAPYDAGHKLSLDHDTCVRIVRDAGHIDPASAICLADSTPHPRWPECRGARKVPPRARHLPKAAVILPEKLMPTSRHNALGVDYVRPMSTAEARS